MEWFASFTSRPEYPVLLGGGDEWTNKPVLGAKTLASKNTLIPPA
jgi:hypothetical protein